MKKWIVAFALLTGLSTFLTLPAQGLAKTDYVLDNDGVTRIATPQTNRITQVIQYLGVEGGMLNNPSDIFVDRWDNIYVADTSNNRIVKLGADGVYERSYYAGNSLNEPGGVFVDEVGDIFIADTKNERIVHIDPQDTVIEEFTRPESELLSEIQDFSIQRLGLTKQGYLYVIRGQKFMAIDANNEFRGFIGANQAGFSLKQLFIRLFASKQQKDKIIRDSIPPYNSFDIGDDGMIYAVLAESQKTGQIVRINTVGDNVYPVKYYGEHYYNRETKRINSAKFQDIAVDRSGIIHVLEQYSGQVYVYDLEGELLGVFGGKGQKKGYFTLPVALDVNSRGDVFVLDSSVGCIHRFERTTFFQNIITAVDQYANGRYEEAYDTWQSVLNIDVNYPVANMGMAKSLYKAGRYDEAMTYYEYAKDKGGYSDAFAEFRYYAFRQNFGWVVLAVVALAGGGIAGVVLLKRYADAIVRTYFAGDSDRT